MAAERREQRRERKSGRATLGGTAWKTISSRTLIAALALAAMSTAWSIATDGRDCLDDGLGCTADTCTADNGCEANWVEVYSHVASQA